MKRNSLVLILGLGLLILLTWFGTVITNIVPHKPTPQVQTVEAGPYRVILQVEPNPPPITQPATLLFTIQLQASQAAVTDAHLSLATSMETMDMGTELSNARSQGPGSYLANVQFSMSGPWKVTLTITRPGLPATNVDFEITAQ
ncbi:MAG TPA: FixH family protein [Ktedonobacteraceae bacterium]|nr:FixH family protein [Ktedonobacteraceae bacterium]